MIRILIVLFLFAKGLNAQSKLMLSLIDSSTIKKGIFSRELFEKQIETGEKNDTIINAERLNVSRATNCKYTLNDSMYTGWHYYLDSLNNIKALGKIVKGIKREFSIDFYTDKKIKSIKSVDTANSKRIKVWIFYETGYLKSLEPDFSIHDCDMFDRIFGGHMEGDYFEFYENGKLKEKFSYDKYNIYGPFILYYNNGRVKEERYYYESNEKLTWKQYNRKGRCIAKIIIKNGKQIGEVGNWRKTSELK